MKVDTDLRNADKMADGDIFIVHQREPPVASLSPQKNNLNDVSPRKESTISLTKSTVGLLPGITPCKQTRSMPWNIGCLSWCRKYFCEGQRGAATRDPEAGQDCGTRLVTRHRRLVGILVPVLVVNSVWWPVMIRWNLWYLFHDRYILTITMLFASAIAGLTSIGGGAIAFPVLTLILNVQPDVARDFALLIQSCGMTSASFTIFFTGVMVDWWAILCCSLGGAVGLVLGLVYVEHHLTPAWKKMTFSSFWFSFAFALFLLNRYRKRKTFLTIPCFNWWKAVVLVLTGIIGGLFTSFVGAGLDICSLSVLTLFFRVTEKSATPTSVVLMAFNSLLGAFWRSAILAEVSTEAWSYFGVSAITAVIAAPFGSVLGMRLHRQVLACIIYVMVALTLVSSFILVPQTPVLTGASVGIILGGSVLFSGLTYIGEKLKTSICNNDEGQEGKEKVEGKSRSNSANSTCSIETVTGAIIGGMAKDPLSISRL